MSTLSLATFTPPNCQLTGTNITLRIYYEQSFIASDGTLVLGGAIGSETFYAEIACSVAGDVLTVPTFDLITTDDTQTGTDVPVSAVLYQNGTQIAFVFSQFIIPEILAPSSTIAALTVYNNALVITYPSSLYLNREQIVDLILDTAPTAVVATEISDGTVRLSAPPGDAAHPKVLVQGDPDVGNISGTLTTSYIPKASGAADIADSRIFDNGTNLIITGLPTSDPAVANALWNSAGTLKISAG